MPTETQQIIITLPAELSAKIRSRVAFGEYPNEEAVVIDLLEECLHLDFMSDEWALREVVPVLNEMEANPSRRLSSEGMRTAIAEEVAEIRKRA